MDWSRSLAIVWRYALVDPATWLDVSWIDGVRSCKATWDGETQTLSSAVLEVDADLPAECYVRAWCEATQDGVTERHAVGTWLVQSPSVSSDGTVRTTSAQAHSPLVELKDDLPPVGWYADGRASDTIADVCSHMRAPLVAYETDKIISSPVVASDDDTWLDVLWALCDAAGLDLSLDGMGRALLMPRAEPWAMSPALTLSDTDPRGFLSASVTDDTDLFGIPNRMEVVWSEPGRCVIGRSTNDDPASPVSTASRGRLVVRRLTNPDGLMTGCTQQQVDEYAERALREESTLTRTWGLTCGYRPLRLGECTRVMHSVLGVDENATVSRVEATLDVRAEMTVRATSTREVW